MIEVYYGAPSIYGRKVLAVLEEKSLDYRILPVNFREADHKKEAYLKLNPNGEIPTIVDDGNAIYESTAIIEYLDEEYPHPPLMPEDSFLRAKVRMIDDFCDLHLYPAIRAVVIKLRTKNENPTDADREEIAGLLGRIETYLGDQSYLVDSFSLADCAFMPVIPSLEGLGLGDLLNVSKKLSGYSARLRLRPGYKGASLLKLETP